MEIDFSSSFARSLLLRALRREDGYQSDLGTLDHQALAREHEELLQIRAAVRAFDIDLDTGWWRKALGHAGYVLSIAGFLSLFGSIADSIYQPALAVVGFISSAGGVILLMISAHLDTNRIRHKRWVLAVEFELNARSKLLNAEIWDRLTRQR